jgi:hypothetical protein
MNRILTTAIIAACTIPAFAEENATAKQDVKVSANADGSGRATITIEANGKKEVRVIDLNKPNTSVVSVASTDSSKQAPGIWLGVAADELSEELAAQLPVTPGTGVLVRHVAENSPAAKIGVQKHDVLLKMDDQVITDGRQLQKLVRAKKAGDIVELTLLRKGQEQKLKATLEQGTQADWGGDTHDLPIIDVGSGKVAVQDILKNYAAAAGAAGGRANIVITSPDGKVVTNLDTGDIKIAPLLRRADQAVKDSNLAEDILKKLEQAIADIRANAERAGEEAARAMKQAEEAARRAAEAARRAEEKVDRESRQKQEPKSEPKPPGQ